MYLSTREEEVMQLLWERGPSLVKELVELYPEPKPHVNTVSTVVRGLEDKGFVGHEPAGHSFRYHALKSREECGRRSFSQLVKGYFNNNYLGAVSTLVEEEKISVGELKELIALIEQKEVKDGSVD